MAHGEIRLTLMTLILAVTLGLIMTTFERSTLSFEHLLVKIGYALPALRQGSRRRALRILGLSHHCHTDAALDADALHG